MAEQTDSGPCRACGGETASGTLKTGNEEAVIVIAGKADEFLGVIPYSTSPMKARVCLKCGLVELFARDVRDLLRIDADV